MKTYNYIIKEATLFNSLQEIDHYLNEMGKHGYRAINPIISPSASVSEEKYYWLEICIFEHSR